MSEGGPISRPALEDIPGPAPVQSEGEAARQAAMVLPVKPPYDPMIVTGCTCILCDAPVALKLPVRIYLQKRMLGEVVMLCTNPDCKAIGTAGFDIKRCDFVQPKKGPVPMED